MFAYPFELSIEPREFSLLFSFEFNVDSLSLDFVFNLQIHLAIHDLARLIVREFGLNHNFAFVE